MHSAQLHSFKKICHEKNESLLYFQKWAMAIQRKIRNKWFSFLSFLFVIEFSWIWIFPSMHSANGFSRFRHSHSAFAIETVCRYLVLLVSTMVLCCFFLLLPSSSSFLFSDAMNNIWILNFIYRRRIVLSIVYLHWKFILLFLSFAFIVLPLPLLFMMILNYLSWNGIHHGLSIQGCCEINFPKKFLNYWIIYNANGSVFINPVRRDRVR